MKYEIKIWKDATKMPDIAPQEAANLLQSVANAVNNAVGRRENKTNPDILIDQNAGGEDAIQSVDISYITKDVAEHEIQNVRAGGGIHRALSAIHIEPAIQIEPAAPQTTNKSRLIKLHIKGNLYLPLDGGLGDAAKRIAGIRKTQGDENKLRDTLLLSQWASVPPEKDNTDHFYRGIVLNIITKAGDFRVITAKKVYVESYVENYNEGEFGTFDLVLVESADATNKVTVKGLGYEKPSLLDKVGKVLSGVAAVAGTAAVVGTSVIGTVEKFTGETAATRWTKYALGTASGVTKSASTIAKNPKNVKSWTDANETINERIQKGVDSKEAIPLAKMESMYLSVIQKDPGKYKEYLEASDAEKWDMLKDASQTMRDRANTTKEMEEETREYYKHENKKEKEEEKKKKEEEENKKKEEEEKKKKEEEEKKKKEEEEKRKKEEEEKRKKEEEEKKKKEEEEKKKKEEEEKKKKEEEEKKKKEEEEKKKKKKKKKKKDNPTSDSSTIPYGDFISEILGDNHPTWQKYKKYPPSDDDDNDDDDDSDSPSGDNDAPPSDNESDSPSGDNDAPPSDNESDSPSGDNKESPSPDNESDSPSGDNKESPSNNNTSNSGTKSAGNQTLNDKIDSAAQKKNGNSNGKS